MATSRNRSGATRGLRHRAIGLGATGIALALMCLPASANEQMRRGAELYELCAQCHGDAGEGMPLALAPAIAGLSEWYLVAQLEKFRSGLRGLHPEDVGGLRMHPMSLTLKEDADLQAVSVYVASLPPVRPEPLVEGGDPARGKQLYAPCVACHGVDGAGNQALSAPGLVHSSDWYLISSLQKYKAGIRGANPQNANAQIMRGMAGTLTDEQAIKDVVAFIHSLGADAK